jgi:hypothetical protein
MSRFAPLLGPDKSTKTMVRQTATPRAARAKRKQAAHPPPPWSLQSQPWFQALSPTNRGAPPTSFLQTKLEIGEPADPLEREADAMAEQVTNAPSTIVQRSCAECSSAPTDDEPDVTVRREARAHDGAMGFEASPHFVATLDGARARGGEALPGNVRTYMEPRFGQDFGDVRVHRDERASVLAEEVQARAFTVGSDLFFRDGEFQPETERGRILIAHELAHVIQQRAGARGVQRQLANERPGALPFGRYVDRFDQVIYDLDYRSQGGNLSKWLQCVYEDGTVIDINIDDIVGMTHTPEGFMDALRGASVGEGGRIFPTIMTQQTTPRLWEAKAAAIRRMEIFNFEFMTTALPAVLFVITIGAAPPISGGGPRPPVQVRPLRRGAPLRPGPQPGQQPGPQPGGRPGSTTVPTTGNAGNQTSSAEALAARQARAPAVPPLTAAQQTMRDSLVREHPGLHNTVASHAVQGAQRVAGQGVAGGDVILLAGGRREITVFTGNLTAQGLGARLVAKAGQQGVTEIFVQVSSGGGSRQIVIDLIQGSGRLRSSFRELEGIFVKVFGPDGSVWWSGLFRGFRG